MRKMLLGLFVAGALWAQQAAAVNRDGYDIPYLGGSLLYELSDGVRDSQNGFGLQLNGGMPLSDHTAAELNFYGLHRKRDIDGQDDYQNGLFANYVHDFGLFGFDRNLLPNFTPYVLGGPGYVVDDVRGTKHKHFGLDGGGGALIPLAIGGWDWGWAVRTEAGLVGQYDRGASVPGHATLWDWHITVGLQIPLTPFFRAHHEAPAAPDCKLAVVNPVTGRRDCLQDSDGDGVPDSLDECPNTPPGTRVDERGCPVSSVRARTAGASVDSDHDGVPDGIDRCPNTPPGVKVDKKGCVVAQTAVVQDLNFETNSAALTGRADSVLDGFVVALQVQANMHLEIDGHTDSSGSRSSNQALSQRRAESVRQYLIGRGVDPHRLTAQGFGGSMPMVSNNTEQGRAINRRVEFKIALQ
jgi:outer membrane protein OmpA-like peptidoglycan-associated protein